MDSLLQELSAIDAAAVVRADYQKTLALLRALKAGKVSLDDVTLTATGWTVGAADSLPAEDPLADVAEDPLAEVAEE